MEVIMQFLAMVISFPRLFPNRSDNHRKKRCDHSILRYLYFNGFLKNNSAIISNIVF